ncbi:MAG: Cof-type HAD-IIB family hydrolase [Terriglobia bacterium]
MPIRLVAIDLDGTLLNSRREISEGNRRALLEAVEREVQVVIVTGRRFHSALPLVSQIPCPVTLITSNGALIANSSEEVLYRDFLPRDVAQQVLEFARKYRPYSVAIFHTPGYGQVTMQDNAVDEGPLGWYVQTSAHCLRLVPDLEAALDRDPIQVMIGGHPAQIEPAEMLLAESPIRSSIHLTWTTYLTTNISILDVMNRGCSKGRALKIWAEQCGIQPGEVMAVGDNFNDLEMLQYAGLPVLMGNHCPELHRPDWTLTLPNDEDGVAEAIRRYVLACG